METLNDILEVTTKPIIYDGDNGGPQEHFIFTVKTLERLGVSAIIIEDKIGLKKNSLFGVEVFQEQDSPKDFAEKIKAGKQAQVTENFMIIARIESLILEQGINDAIMRAKTYLDAGADGIMIHSRQKTFDETKEFAKLYNQLPNLKNIVLFYSPFFNDFDLNYTEQWWYRVFSKILFGVKYNNFILRNLIHEPYARNIIIKTYKNDNYKHKCTDKGSLEGLEYFNIAKNVDWLTPEQFEEHNLKTALGAIKNCFRGKSQFKYLKQMYKAAKQQNINFILCYPCYAKEWIEYMPHEKLLFKLPNNFVKENNVKLINCYNLHYDTHFYIDYNHLNKEGAKLFTLDFVNLLKEYIDF